jgi:hypothetical protein
MTTRARRPTDETGTEVHDRGRGRALFGGSPGDRVGAAPESPQSWERDATEVAARPGAPAVEQPTPTPIDPRPPLEPGTPTELSARPERSEPIRVISMKDRADTARPRTEPRAPLHVQLRSMAEVAGLQEPRNALGRLAPPRDPREVRARRRRDNVVWACVAIILACAISLAIWFVAGG